VEVLSHRVVVLNEGEVIAEGNPMKRCASSAWSTSTLGGLMSSREVAGIVLIAACLMAGTARAQFGVGWHQSPKITVIGADSDPRQPLIDEAVAF
jgi:hypothetical protein